MQDNRLILADSHCHLDFDELARDFDAVMERARSIGIRRFVNIGIQVGRHERALERLKDHSDIFLSVGTHPHWAATETDVTVEQLVALTDTNLWLL